MKQKFKYENYFLIIEDDEEIAEILKSSLEDSFSSCFVIVSKSAIEAKRRLALQKFQAIVVDLNLHKSSGEEVASFIKDKNDFNKETPLIICSGNLHQGRFKLLSAYTKHFLVKPFSPDVLVNKIKQLVEKAKMEEKLKTNRAA